MKKGYKFLVMLSGGLLFTGCGLIADIVYSHIENCKIKVNKRFIKNSCGLGNGIQFEKLTVIRKDSSGVPSDYYITERFDGNYSGQQASPRKIYFHKTNEHYKWRSDTVNIHIIRGSYGERVFDTLQYRSINHHLSGQKHNTCPVTFQKGNWYYFSSPMSRNSGRYLFVDEKMNFHIHKY